MNEDKGPILEVRDLTIVIDRPEGTLTAVEDVNLRVARGEVLGLVGESGSGKTLTGFAIMGALDPPVRISKGRIDFKGEDLAKASAARLRSLRGNRIAMILQDPMMTLNPALTIGTQMTETVHAHADVSRRRAREMAVATLKTVGFGDAEARLSSYPHEYSGGMRQRVAIAIALLHQPDLIIADEPTTALDVTVQAQILSEVQRLARVSGAAWIWITHDLSVVAGLADRVAVMYAGTVVERGPTQRVMQSPRHPYTRGLLDCSPESPLPESPLQADRRLRQIDGTAPALQDRPAGCVFAPRCPRADSTCGTAPQPSDNGRGQVVACWHPLSGALP